MLISEAIAQLEQIKDEHGDLSVYSESIDGNNETIQKIRFGEALLCTFSGKAKKCYGAILELL